MEIEKPYDYVKISLVCLYIIILWIGAIFNIYINYLGKGETWDLYPFAEVLWVILCIIISLRVKTFKQLFLVVILFLLLDSWVDLIAMGHPSWWAGPPILVEWKWGTINTTSLLHQYWFIKWGLQTPVRCLAMAFNLSQIKKRVEYKKRILVIFFSFIGLFIMLLAAAQDILFYFVWRGLYDPNFHYFRYLFPKGYWNLYNMLFIRLPIMFGFGITLLLLSKHFSLEYVNKKNHLEVYYAVVLACFLAIILIILMVYQQTMDILPGILYPLNFTYFFFIITGIIVLIAILDYKKQGKEKDL